MSRCRPSRLLVTAVALAVGAAVLTAVPSTVRAATTSDASGNAYLTIVAGRSLLDYVDENGTPVPGVLSAFDVADQLAALHLAATGVVVLPYTGDVAPLQVYRNTYPTWAQLQDLRTRYHWRFVDGGTHASLIGMTPDQVRAESCGTLTTLVAKGFPESVGEYAPGDNDSDAASQAIVTQCFDFVRMYNPRGITSLATAPTGWKAKTLSLGGGNCLNTSAPCSTGFTRTYTAPSTIASCGLVDAGSWCAVQYYHLVVGDRLTGTPRWSCSAPSPRRHWTSLGEFYCATDFFTALAAMPKTLVNADPATVAQAWGRTPPVPALEQPPPRLAPGSPGDQQGTGADRLRVTHRVDDGQHGPA